MNRITARFGALRANGRCGLVTYVTAGDPAPRTTVPLLHALAGAGADIIELGVPFSDPTADGPVVQAACERALAQGVDLAAVLAMAAEFRRKDSETPLVLMGYLNPIVAMGEAAFADAAAAAGIDGVIAVDLPSEEAGVLRELLHARGIDLIFLLAPTTTDTRAAQIAAAGSGFLYYVSLKGTTGAGHLDTRSVSERLAIIRRHTRLPLAVGFGIRDAAGAAALAETADAVVIGSALIETIAAAGKGAAEQQAAAAKFTGELRQALERAATAPA